MYREAYYALEAIRVGELEQLSVRAHWVDAFKTCRWVVETESGPTLTHAGLEACQDLSKRYRSRQAA